MDWASSTNCSARKARLPWRSRRVAVSPRMRPESGKWGKRWPNGATACCCGIVPIAGHRTCASIPSGESRMQARALLGLISALELGPTALAAGSAGARVSLLAAAAAPEAISHLSLWWISGGIASLMMLGASYCCEPAIVAAAKGMEAVAAMPAFADQINAIRAAARSSSTRIPPSSSPPWSDGQPASFRARLPGSRHDRGGLRQADHADPACRCQPHRSVPPGRHRRVGRAADPPCRGIPAPWPYNIFDQRIDDAAARASGLFIDWPDLAPTIAEFIGRRQ